MKTAPLRPGDHIQFRDHNGIAHPGIFVGRNPGFVRVISGEIEVVVAVGNLVLGGEAA